MSPIKKEELTASLCERFDTRAKDGRKNAVMSPAKFTDALYPCTKLFSPISYNGLRARTRIVYIPERETALCGGAPTTAEREHFFACVSGGAGLSVTAPVSVGISAFTAAPWRELCSGVHARGGLILAQLGFEAEKPDISGILSPDRECERLIRLAVQSAVNAMTVGFDGVCLRGNAGAFLDKMSSKAWNRARLGKFSDAALFGTELVKAIRARIGEKAPILFRFSLSHAVNESYGERVAEVKELSALSAQRSIADSFKYMEALVGAGVDTFEITLGCAETPWLASPASYMPAGCYLDAARAAAERFLATGMKTNAGKEVCVLGSGRIDTPDTAEEALRNNFCHAVVLGSAMDADPAWGSKAKSGKCADILPYYAPAAGCELPELPADAKRIAVVGGGMRGMLTALEAAEAGMAVELFEKEFSLGGSLRTLSALPQNYAAENYLFTLMNAVANRPGITLKTGVTADCELLKAGNYDAVVFANGGKAAIPAVGGWGEIPYISVQELMLYPENLGEIRKNIVILGGNELGCACALYLKEQLGCSRIALISSGKNVMEENTVSDRAWMAHRLSSLGVRMFTLSKPEKIQEGYLYFRERCGKKPDPAATWKTAEEKIKAEDAKLRSVRAELIVPADAVPDKALYLNAQADEVAPVLLYV